MLFSSAIMIGGGNMSTVKIIGYEDWSVYNGFAEGSGRGEKLWLQSKFGEIGLFKFPKVDPLTLTSTTEYISEHMSHQIGEIINVKTAKVDIGVRNQRIGCMSYLLNKPDEAIIEGADFIIGKHPDYDTDEMKEKESGKYYSIEHLLEACESHDEKQKIIQMMLFDYLIGNSDRHQNNWAILVKSDKRQKNFNERIFCPLYDNGSSLCSYVTDEQAKEILGKDKTRFEAIVNTKSRSMIRIDATSKNRPTHLEVAEYLLRQYPEAKNIAFEFCSSLTMRQIETLIEQYQDLASENKLKLIKLFLVWKIEKLGILLNEV